MNRQPSRKGFAVLAVTLGWIAFAGSAAFAHNFLIDLTHPTPTFEPLDGDLNKPDMSKPIGNSDPRGIPSFGPQTVYQVFPPFKTGQGYFYFGRFAATEHHGTHVDAPGHYVNNPETLETKKPVKLLSNELTPYDLVARAVVIDISSRVRAELDKNGGKPSPDVKVTDFSDNSPNNVTADDIAAVAGKLRNKSWLVVNLGWSRFFYEADWKKSPYMNGFNFPGVSKAAVDKIIEIEDRKGIRINGIVIDNIGVDTGESSKGIDDKFTNSFYSHVRGLQRGWKLVENATNLGQLAMARPDSCTVVVGAPKHVGSSGGPSRVIAICEK